MHPNLFHVFRNTPLGRETLMQSLYFCKTLDVGLTLCIPDAVHFMMYFARDAVQLERDPGYYEQRIREAGLEKPLAQCCRDRYQFADGEFANNLYELPHDTLILSGAYGHGLIKNILFGSKVEIAQATLTNSVLVSGPHSRTHLNRTDGEKIVNGQVNA